MDYHCFVLLPSTSHCPPSLSVAFHSFPLPLTSFFYLPFPPSLLPPMNFRCLPLVAIIFQLPPSSSHGLPLTLPSHRLLIVSHCIPLPSHYVPLVSIASHCLPIAKSVSSTFQFSSVSFLLPLISSHCFLLPPFAFPLTSHFFLFKSFVFYCLPFPSTSFPITYPLPRTDFHHLLLFTITSHCLQVCFRVSPSALCQPLLASPCLLLFLDDSHHILTDFLSLPPTAFHHLPFIVIESQCTPIDILLFPPALPLSIIDFYCHPLLSS